MLERLLTEEEPIEPAKPAGSAPAPQFSPAKTGPAAPTPKVPESDEGIDLDIIGSLMDDADDRKPGGGT